jgi:hypothetical protein
MESCAGELTRNYTILQLKEGKISLLVALIEGRPRGQVNDAAFRVRPLALSFPLLALCLDVSLPFDSVSEDCKTGSSNLTN